MAITTEFINTEFGTLNVYDDGVLFYHQPFKPSSDGGMHTWNEEEALKWWDEKKVLFIDVTKYFIDENGEIVEKNTGRQ